MSVWEVLIFVGYAAAVAYLGYLGWRRTRGAGDFLLAGRKAHPVIMALSYGAAFISTSAIVGFGGVAGRFGMSLLWLVALNIFVGIFIAFVVLGGRTRRVGHALDCHTFPELLGKRFDSRFVQVLAGLIIFAFMPLYAAAVLIGACEFLVQKFQIDYNVALALFAVVVAVYVIVGGLKSVMYVDALQGGIMVAGMVVLLVATYAALGGVSQAHRSLTELAPLAPPADQGIGHRGWTAMPAFGWGETAYSLWWIVVSTITLGVGVGVLAQPQLAVRFMTVKGQRELNRAVLFGGLFVLLIPGVAYTVGSLSNAWYAAHGEPIVGRVVEVIDAERDFVRLQPMARDEGGAWVDTDAAPVAGVRVTDPALIPAGDETIAAVRSVAMTYADSDSNKIIPRFITSAMPPWFGLLFLLTLLAAAMSTLAGQFHAIGASVGRDVVQSLRPANPASIAVTRGGMLVAILAAVGIAAVARGQAYVIARFTVIFFGVCTAAFLPAYVGGLFSRRVTPAGAKASMVVGTLVSIAWLVLVKAPEAPTLGICQMLFGRAVLIAAPNWAVVDPLVIALPVSVLVLVVVSAVTARSSEATLAKIFD